MNNTALDSYCNTLMKVRTQQAEAISLNPYLEYFASIHLKAYFINNDNVAPIMPMYIYAIPSNFAILRVGFLLIE